ncbi:LysR family transcriptional regulator [Pseudochelatococcus sp. B33]
MTITFADPDLLRTFIAVTEQRSFTGAAGVLGTRQSAVSQKIARLEAQLDRQLFVRTTHNVTVTMQGAALIPFAREVIAAHHRLEQFVTARSVRGLVRLGISEDFALTGLSDILSLFRTRFSDIELELSIGLSGNLYREFDAGQIDVLFAKRPADEQRGEIVWREQLVWVSAPQLSPDPEMPLPLVVYPPPSITRASALAALDRAGREWRIVCTAGSLNGLIAAAAAGLGFMPHSRRLIPPGLATVAPAPGLPDPGTVEFVVLQRNASSAPASALTQVLRNFATRR